MPPSEEGEAAGAVQAQGDNRYALRPAIASERERLATYQWTHPDNGAVWFVLARSAIPAIFSYAGPDHYSGRSSAFVYRACASLNAVVPWSNARTKDFSALTDARYVLGGGYNHFDYALRRGFSPPDIETHNAVLYGLLPEGSIAESYVIPIQSYLAKTGASAEKFGPPPSYSRALTQRAFEKIMFAERGRVARVDEVAVDTKGVVSGAPGGDGSEPVSATDLPEAIFSKLSVVCVGLEAYGDAKR